MTQQELADKLHVSLKTITNWEKGHVEIPETKLVMLRNFFDENDNQEIGRVNEPTVSYDIEEGPHPEISKILRRQSDLPIEQREDILIEELIFLKGYIKRKFGGAKKWWLF